MKAIHPSCPSSLSLQVRAKSSTQPQCPKVSIPSSQAPNTILLHPYQAAETKCVSLKRTNRIIFEHAQRSMRSGPYEGFVVSGEGHGHQPYGNGTGFCCCVLACGVSIGGLGFGVGTFLCHCLSGLVVSELNCRRALRSSGRGS